MSGKTDSTLRPRNYVVGAIALVLVGLVIGLGLSAGLNVPHALQAKPGSGPTTALVQGSAPLPESPFANVAEKAIPAVVFVNVNKKTGGAESDDPQDELFRRFFGDLPRNHPRTQPSSGSGFIIESDGHILTNNHVVKDAQDITVTLEDKRTFKAKVVGTDASTDVAVIKIDADHLPTVPLGDSDQMRVGDWAIAIGNPLGVLRGSVTVGVISARGRSGLDIFGSQDLQFQDFIQTDASINFGNSGGPLCNIRGEAIGINTAINPSGQGIGFAIPINLAKHVAEQLMAHGSVKRAMMGVRLADLTPEMAEGFGLNVRDGVVIQEVLPGSPAEKAGMKRNDVVVGFDGEPVTDMAKFRIKVADTQTGRRIPIDVLRGGKKLSLSIALSDRDEKFLAANDGQGQGETPGTQPETQALGGLAVRELTAEERSNLGVDGGVLVTSVKDGSAAEEAGIQANDVIEEVNTQSVVSAVAFKRLLQQARDSKKKHAVLLVKSGSRTSYIPLNLQ